MERIAGERGRGGEGKRGSNDRGREDLRPLAWRAREKEKIDERKKCFMSGRGV